jgi:hypothetical protein
LMLPMTAAMDCEAGLMSEAEVEVVAWESRGELGSSGAVGC